MNIEKPTGEELAALVLAAMPNPERVTIQEVGATKVIFTWQGPEWHKDDRKTHTLEVFSLARNKHDLTVFEYAKITPMNRRPPAWSNSTNMCAIVRALLQQRWAIYGMRETLRGLTVVEDEPTREAKIIKFAN